MKILPDSLHLQHSREKLDQNLWIPVLIFYVFIGGIPQYLMWFLFDTVRGGKENNHGPAKVLNQAGIY